MPKNVICITEVEAGSEAERAHLKIGDYVLKYNGIFLHGNARHLSQLASAMSVNTMVELVVERGGEETVINVKGGALGIKGKSVDQVDARKDASGQGSNGLDIKKLTDNLLLLGILITIGAVVWWVIFYSQVTSELGTDLGEAFSCLYSSEGGCGFVSGVAQMGGMTPYNPMVFWIGSGLLGLGILLNISRKSG